ncbi:MAG: HEAT repeat domain-containing protein, partial [Candidatus Hinthialibacter sp.]
YMPHKIYGQHIDYMFQTPTTQVWKKMYDEGKLQPPQTYFWETKPPEELYDLQNDPDEVNNLADSPQHREILEKMRQAHKDWVFRIRDVGFLPEGEIHARSQGSTPYQMGHDESAYPLKKIFAAADTASSLNMDAIPDLQKALEDDDGAVRYWAALGILMREADGLKAAHNDMKRALHDKSPYVRIAAAEALGKYGSGEDAAQAVQTLMELVDVEKTNAYVAIAALNAIDELGEKAADQKKAIQTLPSKDPSAPARANGYVSRLIQTITGSE